MSGEKLPIVLIKYICSFFDTETFCKFRLVCKKFNELFFEILRDFKLVGDVDDPCFLTKFKNLISLEIGNVFTTIIHIPKKIKNIEIKYQNMKYFKFPSELEKLYINYEFDEKKIYRMKNFNTKKINKLILRNIKFNTDIEPILHKLNDIQIRHLKIYNVIFNEFNYNIPYVECRCVLYFKYPLEFFKCEVYSRNLTVSIKTIDINKISEYLTEVDLTNVENIIFRNISKFPKANYYFKDKNKITFIDCSNEFIKFLDC